MTDDWGGKAVVEAPTPQTAGDSRAPATAGVAAPCVLVVDPIHETALRALRERFDVVVRPRPSEAELLRLAEDADVIVMRSGVELTGEVIRAAPRLRLIARAGVGVDNIDLDAARERGICAFNIPDVTSISCAEFTFALLLAVARRVSLADRQMRDNVWAKAELYGLELHGKTLGVVGVGRIGARVAAIGQGFGMRTIGSVANPSRQRRRALARLGVELRDLDEILAEADVVSVHVPLTDACRDLIGAPELDRMKPSAYLVDVSRGGVVDEDALYEALHERRIAGAAKDVFVSEGARTRLAELDNVVLTPHIGSMTHTAQERVAGRLVEGILNGLDGGRVRSRLC